tara:strand:- start:298 stop:735 length:438 start_codon:yes stop_codon:yes gene_type:complete
MKTVKENKAEYRDMPSDERIKNESIQYQRILDLVGDPLSQGGLGWPAWRGKSAGRYYKGRMVKSKDVGHADIEFLIPPFATLCCFEVKKPKEPLSEAQVECQQKVKDAGGYYWRVETFEECERWIEDTLMPTIRCLQRVLKEAQR